VRWRGKVVLFHPKKKKTNAELPQKLRESFRRHKSLSKKNQHTGCQGVHYNEIDRKMGQTAWGADGGVARTIGQVYWQGGDPKVGPKIGVNCVWVEDGYGKPVAVSAQRQGVNVAVYGTAKDTYFLRLLVEP